MIANTPPLNWVPFDNWLLFTPCWCGARGLFALYRGDRLMFRGYGATPKSDLASRVKRYRSGDERGHYAGKMIYKHRAELQLQICVLDLPEDEIRAIHAQLIDERRPPWNVPKGDWRHR